MDEAETLSPWVIFDADNTLWSVEPVYDRARDLFCDHVSELLRRRSPKSVPSKALVEQLQRHRDIQLQLTHGYSAARFARSFEDTLTFLLPFSASAEELTYVRTLATDVFEKEAEICEDLHLAIDKLCSGYRLGIITAGEEWVQQRRLASFKLRHHFFGEKIVKQKSSEEFRRFCSDNKVDVASSWVVGDSVSSDIIPARAAGLRVIHFDAPNWRHEHADKPEDVLSAKTMQEVVRIILEHT
jgi:putative hydrolase of the HAD superfamily